MGSLPESNKILLPVLGEDEFSYGFDGRGLKAENGQFEEFGQTFGENDVIGCFAVSAPESCGSMARSGLKAASSVLFPVNCCLVFFMHSLFNCVLQRLE